MRGRPRNILGDPCRSCGMVLDGENVFENKSGNRSGWGCRNCRNARDRRAPIQPVAPSVPVVLMAPDFVFTEAVRYVLRSYREDLGLSQRVVAAQTHLGEKSISSWENGARIEAIGLMEVAALLNFYGVSFTQFASEITTRYREFQGYTRERKSA